MRPIHLIDPPVKTMSLLDGRQLTWQEFGVPDGQPAVYFHGGGSISLEAGLFHREAVQYGVRLIAPNRPGAGGSSLCPGRAVARYSQDLSELLDELDVGKFACFGESNGGMVTMAVAATMSERVVGAVPINPTMPWFDPVARTVSSSNAALGYRLMRLCPWLLAKLAPLGVRRARRERSFPRSAERFSRQDLVGPAPGTEQDVSDFQWQVMLRSAEQGGLSSELAWASSPWGFDHYDIPPRLDFFCGVYDAQAPFALVLADRNPNARFHYFSFGHYGFSHPDARRRIIEKVSSYFDC